MAQSSADTVYLVGSNADTRDFIFGKPGYPDLSDRVKLVPPTPALAACCNVGAAVILAPE